jgi:hypothetical protein
MLMKENHTHVSARSPAFRCACSIEALDCVAPERRMFRLWVKPRTHCLLHFVVVGKSADSQCGFHRPKKMKFGRCKVRVVSWMGKNLEQKLCKCGTCVGNRMWRAVVMQENCTLCQTSLTFRPYFRPQREAKHVAISRGVLHGFRMGSYEPLVNAWLVIRATYCCNRKSD